MAPKETNEEATWRRMKGAGKSHGKGGKGKKGKGSKGKDSGPPSSTELPEHRREELSALLDDFLASSEMQVQMPSNITGLERKFLHEQAEMRKLTTQSFGQGKDRYICIFKEAAKEDEVPRSAVIVGKATYSAVFLDAESQNKVLEFCHRTIAGGIPEHWTKYSDHMTICMGPLCNPKTEDSRSVAETVKSQISRYYEGQHFQLKAVSWGLGQDADVMAVGVIGCVSCNRNPHITVATAPQVAPHSSNLIRKWTMLATEEQFTLTGQLRQQGAQGAQGAQAAEAAAASPKAGADASWHGLGFKLGFLEQPKGNGTEESWFGIGKADKPWDDRADSTAMVLGFSKEDAATFTFEEVGRTKGGELVNPATLQGGVRVPSVPVYSFHQAGTYVGEVDEGPGPEYFLRWKEPSYSLFAFLPLEELEPRPIQRGEPVPPDCCYGMYHVDIEAGSEHYHYWMDGDYPVYIISNQLCRASDECYPPCRFRVSFSQDRIVMVDIDQGRVVCRSMAGDELLESALGTLGELRQQVAEVLQPQDAVLSLLHATTGKRLTTSLDGKDLRELIA